MRTCGFTLLETLLAISLTVSVGIAALSLTTMQARVGAAARAQEETLALITETVRLLDEDLLLAVQQPAYGRFLVQEPGALRLVTSCRLPGESAGLREILWHFDAAAGTALRSSTPLAGGVTTTRAVGRDWKWFSLELDQEALFLNGRIGTSAEPWRLPLWTESQ